MASARKPREARAGARARLGACLAAAAGPYGYTISLGGSIALSSGEIGKPHLEGVLLMTLGAVVAFVALGAAAQDPAEPLTPLPPTVWGNAHVPAAGLALCSVWAVDQVTSRALGWLLTGLAATAVYLVVAAAQQTAVAALRERR